MTSFIDNILNFISTYYIDPIRYDTGYNPVNTITWALILGVCIFGIIKLLDRLKITVDEKFIFSVLPFVFAGSSMRVLEDANVFSAPFSYLLITPNIYFAVFVATVICLVISRWLQSTGNVKDYRTAFAGMGIAWFVINIIALVSTEDISRPYVPLIVLIAATLITYIAYRVFRYGGSELLSSRLNMTILWAHLADATSTVVGVDLLGYYEKHVVPAYLIELTGTAVVMYPLKLMIFIPVLYLLDTQFNDNDESRRLSTFVKMVIIILGLSPAVRNTIRITFGI